MVSYFDEEPNLASRAQQIWQILVGAAHNRQILTYKIIAKLLGYDGAGVLDRQLGHIMFYCMYNNLPPLTVLVVNEAEGSPGGGLLLEGKENSERERVYKFDWFNVIPPSQEQLAEVYRRGMEEHG